MFFSCRVVFISFSVRLIHQLCAVHVFMSCFTSYYCFPSLVSGLCLFVFIYWLCCDLFFVYIQSINIPFLTKSTERLTIIYSYLMCSQAIDQMFFPSVLGTAQVFYCPQPLASGNRTPELLPIHWEKYSDLLPGYTLNNCIILYLQTISLEQLTTERQGY